MGKSLMNRICIGLIEVLDFRKYVSSHRGAVNTILLIAFD
jgi:hypothetical protein